MVLISACEYLYILFKHFLELNTRSYTYQAGTLLLNYSPNYAILSKLRITGTVRWVSPYLPLFHTKLILRGGMKIPKTVTHVKLESRIMFHINQSFSVTVSHLFICSLQKSNILVGKETSRMINTSLVSPHYPILH